MVSVILFILSVFRPERIVQVRRVPPTKNLRAHLLGLTFGLLFVTSNLCFNFTLAHLYQSFFVFLSFALVTYFGGVLVFLALLYWALSSFAGPASGVFHNMLVNGGHWYFLGYCFGASFAIFYNDLLFLFFHLFEKKKIKIVFAYDPQKSVNVIKSPDATQEHALNALFTRKRHLREQRLYQYNLKSAPPHPYTIAFVANPKIRKRGGDITSAGGYEPDPIIRDRDLFLRAVDRALFSLETDPVIGRPEIWSRIRVITVFNPALAEASNSGSEYGMIEEFQEELEQDGERVDNNMLDPMRQMFKSFENMLALSSRGERITFNTDDVDVIFAITASLTHTRAFAHFSDWIEHDEANPLENQMDRAGKKFSFNATPFEATTPTGSPAPDRDCPRIKDDIVYPTVNSETAVGESLPSFRAVHDYCPTRPGRIALNVISARHKTYIHEFAHAMSSAFHGTVADEYVDLFVLKKNGVEEKPEQTPHFFVNRIDRNIDATEPIPVPKVFAEYNCVQYHSDLAHPSAEEEWTGYFPDKFDKHTPCMMDRDVSGYYRFDELLSSFIYDRMMAKVSRPAKCEHQIEPPPVSE